jgi:hypothetical protein
MRSRGLFAGCKQNNKRSQLDLTAAAAAPSEEQSAD